MNKVLAIGWKDLVVMLRDRAALVLMLAAPFVLIVGMGLVTGAFARDDGPSGIGTVQVALVNLDEGQLGQALIDVFESEDLADLVAPRAVATEAEARALVEDDAVAAAVIVPAGFSAGIIPDMTTGETAVATPIELYSNPGMPISAGVVNTIVTRFVSTVETNMASVEVTMRQLVENGAVDPGDMDALLATGQAVGARLFTDAGSAAAPIAVRTSSDATRASEDFNPLAYLAPGMAVLFLMYTTTQGGRSILSERDGGTLGRLLISPTATWQVLGGKVFGIFALGVLQLAILIGGSALLFQLDWGSPLGVLLIILATSAAATGWGLLLASLARTPGQVSSIGTAMMLAFGILGGSFFPFALTGALGVLRKMTPNAWALDSFAELSSGAAVVDILPALLALIAMALVLFGISVLAFRRQRTLA